MSRRQPLKRTVLGALLLAAGITVAPAQASETVRLRLSNTNEVPVSEMTFQPVPVGLIEPPVIGTDPDGQPIEGNPLSALPSSEGIDLSSVIVLLTTEAGDGGSELDRLFLLFGYEDDPNAGPDDPPFVPLLDDQGGRVGTLAPGGHFDFDLSLSETGEYTKLVPDTSGLTLSLLDVPSPGGTPGDEDGGGAVEHPGGEGVQVPEPSTLLLWGSLAVAGLIGARLRHRREAA